MSIIKPSGGDDMTDHKYSDQLLVPGLEHELKKMKTEIAEEFGVEMGSKTSSRLNGRIGGEMTKRLIENAQEQQRARARKE